jgi:hypothetical protein
MIAPPDHTTPLFIIDGSKALAKAIRRSFGRHGVIAITREGDEALSLGGAGEPVEWAVEIHRSPVSVTPARLHQKLTPLSPH